MAVPCPVADTRQGCVATQPVQLPRGDLLAHFPRAPHARLKQQRQASHARGACRESPRGAGGAAAPAGCGPHRWTPGQPATSPSPLAASGRQHRQKVVLRCVTPGVAESVGARGYPSLRCLEMHQRPALPPFAAITLASPPASVHVRMLMCMVLSIQISCSASSRPPPPLHRRPPPPTRSHHRRIRRILPLLALPHQHRPLHPLRRHFLPHRRRRRHRRRFLVQTSSTRPPS